MLSRLKHWIGHTFFDFAYGIVYRDKNNDMLLINNKDKENINSNRFRILTPAFRYWYADPMPVTLNNTEYVFCEVYDRKKKKGFIGRCSYNKRGKLQKPMKILEEPFHLSFPLIFTFHNHTYMMPECSMSGQLRFYELNDDFTKTELVRTFHTDSVLVDTVVIIREDEVLLISCQEEPTDAKKTKLIFYRCKDIQNGELLQIKCKESTFLDNYSYKARNGGAIIRSKKEIYRVIQESTKDEYGRNTIITRMVLNKDNDYVVNFEEEEIATIYANDLNLRLPLWYRLQGTHTYGYSDNKEVVDVSFTRFHLGNLFMKK